MKKDAKWEDIGFIASSESRKKILKLLESPKMPSSLSKESGINKTHISRALKELVNKKMAECKNPNIAKGKFYAITEYGDKILKKIDSL